MNGTIAARTWFEPLFLTAKKFDGGKDFYERSSMRLTKIAPLTDLYRQEIRLRDAVLRKPLGMVTTTQDIADEADHQHYGLVDGNRLLACVVIVKLASNSEAPNRVKLRQMAVAPDLQGQGLGKSLIEQVERQLQRNGVLRIELHARETAAKFYEKLGFRGVGELFTEVGIPHLKMEKRIGGLPIGQD